jgi:hypothetical protein
VTPDESVGVFRTVDCMGGACHGYRMGYTEGAEPVTQISIPVREPCGCVGTQVYDVWGELAIAAWYEWPALHAFEPDLKHPAS